MTIPRAERLRITQEVYKQWQEIYGDREDSEAESVNWDMLNKAMAEAEVKYNDRPANSETHPFQVPICFSHFFCKSLPPP